MENDKTEAEKGLLIDLVLPHKNIIENIKVRLLSEYLYRATISKIIKLLLYV